MMKHISKVKLKIWAIILSFSPLMYYAQTSICEEGTPSFVVDLEGYQNQTWFSDYSERGGHCCSASNSDDCIEFIVSVDSNITAVKFEVTDGSLSPGALYYQINCSDPAQVGVGKCLIGPGPHNLTFCKPGSNLNQYAITPIPLVEFSPDITTRVDCSRKIGTKGLNPSTLQWTSVYPGNQGEYDHLLSCTSNCDTSIVTPELGVPDYIDYQICGSPYVPECFAQGTYCDTVRVYFNPALSGTVTPNPAYFCNGESGVDVTVNASGGSGVLSYRWYTGSDVSGSYLGDGISKEITSNGQYSVEIRDDLFPTCLSKVLNFSTAHMNVTSSVSNVNHVTCKGLSNGSFQVDVIGGLGSYQYSIDGVNYQNSNTFNNLIAGDYTVIVLDSSECTDQVNVTIDEPKELELDYTLSNYNGVNVSCFGSNNGGVSLSISGGTPNYSYTWTTNNGNGVITNQKDQSTLTAGIYSVEVSDLNNCIIDTTLTIIEPLPISQSIASVNDFNGYDVSCYNGSNGAIDYSATGGTPPYQYNWSSSDGISINSSTQNQNDVTIGTFNVTVTDNNGCYTDTSITLSQPPQLELTLTPNNAMCGDNNGEISSSASGGVQPYSYEWNTGAGEERVSGLSGGEYHLEITDLNGCKTSNSLRIEQHPKLELTSSVKQPLCFDDLTGEIEISVTSGTAPYSYDWGNGTNSNTLSNIGEGGYTVTVSDFYGCIASLDINLNYPPLLEVELTSPEPLEGFNISKHEASDGIVNSEIIGGTSPYDISWSNGETSNSIKNLVVGNYSVTVTDANGCFVKSSILLVEPDAIDMPTGITPNGDGKNDVFYVKGIEPYNEVHLKVVNRWGNIVYYNEHYNNDWAGTSLKGGNLPDGTYFVILRVDEEELILRNYLEIRH